MTVYTLIGKVEYPLTPPKSRSEKLLPLILFEYINQYRRLASGGIISTLSYPPIKKPPAKEVGYGKISEKGLQPKKNPSDPRLGTLKARGY